MGLILTNNRLIYVRKIASQNSITIILVTLLFACIYTVESSVTNSLDSIKVPLDIYVPLMFVFCFSAWNYVGQFRVVPVLTRFLAKHSMTMYFEHILVLYFFRRIPLFGQGMLGMLLLLFVVFIISCLLAIPLDGLTYLVKAQKSFHVLGRRPKVPGSQ